MTVQKVNKYDSTKKANKLLSISMHVKKYLIVYTLLSILISIPFGYYTKNFTAHNKELLSNLVILFAIATIYPSMVQLRTEGEDIKKAFKSWKIIGISMLYVFVLSPLLAYIFAPSLGKAGVGFFVGNIVPASSSSIGYVLIVDGSIEIATALSVLSLIIAIPAIPIFLSLYGSHHSTVIPITPILSALIYILVIPFIAGQLTRYPLYKKKGKTFVNETLKPYLSLATMLSMLALIFVLVEKISTIIISKPATIILIIVYEAVVILVVLAIAIIVSKAMHFSYKDHQALTFTSITKNQSVAAAIAVMALTPMAAIAPAVIPMIQPVIAILYIQMEGKVRKMFKN